MGIIFLITQALFTIFFHYFNYLTSISLSLLSVINVQLLVIFKDLQ